jgi:hypothetical protein
MSDLVCPCCGNPSRDGGLCDTDEDRLAKTLAAAPDLLGELLVQASRQSVTSAHGKSADEPLPLDLKAADLAAEYEALLLSWARACAAYGDPSLPGSGRSAARWLAERIYGVRVHDAAGEIVDELTHLARECWRAVDTHGADLIYIGDCAALLPPNDEICRTPLRVRQGLKQAVCWRCEATYDVVEMLTARDATIDNYLATAAEIARVGFRTPDGRRITLPMIEGYARRGSIAHHSTRMHLGKEVKLYRIGEVKQAALNAKYPKLARTA